MSEKAMKELAEKHNLRRKLTEEEKAKIAIGVPYDGAFVESPEKLRELYEKIYPKVDETWWTLREKIIAMIEGHFGTMSSIPWRDVSCEDMQKLMVIVCEHRECIGASDYVLNHLNTVVEMAMWCQEYETDFGDPRSRQR